MQNRYPKLPTQWGPAVAEQMDKALADLAAIMNLTVESPIELCRGRDSFALRVDLPDTDTAQPVIPSFGCMPDPASAFRAMPPSSQQQVLVEAAAAATMPALIACCCCPQMFVPSGGNCGSLTQSQEEEYLSGDYSINADNTWEDAGGGSPLQITLPVIGKYLIWGNARMTGEMSAGSVMCLTARIYDNTAAAAIANSERMGVVSKQTAVQVSGNAPFSLSFTTTVVNTVIKMQIKRNTGPTWTTSKIESGTCGRSNLGYTLYQFKC